MRPAGARSTVEVQVDLEGLGPGLLLGQHPVGADGPESAQLDPVAPAAVAVAGRRPLPAPSPAAGASPAPGWTAAGASSLAKATSSRPLGPIGWPVMCSRTVMACGPLGRRSDHSR